MNKTIGTTIIAAAAATGAAFTAMAIDEFNVAAGQTLTTNGVSASSAIKKTGDGTLVLSGANTLKRLQVAAGTVNIHGGSTAISDSGATGTETGKQVFEQIAGDTVIDGGATLTLSAGQYAITESGTLIITNATLDATGLSGHFMNAFRTSTGSDIAADGCKIVIDNGGVLKVGSLRPTGSPTQGKPALRDLVGVELKEGGKLYISQFWTDNNVSRYGRIWFDGGVVYPQSGSTRIFNDGNSREPWTQGELVPTVMKGGAYFEDSLGNVVYPAFQSGVGAGETDGGVHIKMPAGNDSTFFWMAKNSTYNGGTFIESHGNRRFGINAENGDQTFGAVPSAPETNIWVSGSRFLLYNQGGVFNIHPNRTIHVDEGVEFRAVANSGARLVIGGEIRADIPEGQEYAVNNSFEAVTNLTGTVVIGPGDGRTNDIGRIIVKGWLEVTNGVTLATSPTASSGTANAVLLVQGNNSSWANTKGHLAVTGGTLLAPQVPPSGQTYFAYVIQYGQADICGGTVDMPKLEWLNAQNTPARTIIRDGGVLNVGTFRVAQSVTGNPTVVRLGTNGLLRTNHLFLDTSKTKPEVTFLFDGGALQSGNGASDFISSYNNAIWDNVTFAIGPGGAVFDDSNDQHIFWRKPLVKYVASEPDGGLTARGRSVQQNVGRAVCLMVAADYNGPTTVDCTTLQQRGGDNLLPSGTKLVLKNGGIAAFCTYSGDYTTDSSEHTAATIGGIEGDGTLNYCTHVTVNGKIAPSIGGTINFHKTCSLSGTLEIDGDSTSCGRVKFQQTQDISGLTLSIKDPSKLDSNAQRGTYKIVDNANYTGTFTLVPDFPSDKWQVKYASNGVYLEPVKAFTMVIR